ncbi:amidase [Melanomma pulvis-pyrius CBS 109.77]|uniref:Amidase n=1 Tax=Melanomma pulvis-pyrius CBS 109.77 TaxID=1314802 RepID=A0A6A6WSR6_9PLEO|nr:amidase [Melanomma pulvis-pyrius CBS 109.77]
MGLGRWVVFAPVIGLFASFAAARPITPCTPSQPELPPLINATISALVKGLQSKQFTSVDLVEAYIRRIHEVNSALHAVIEVNCDALDLAAQLDAERADGQIRGPLHGIPILIKNNIATKDGMNTTSGSYALLKSTVPEDSTIARKLREAGAILLGKTNLSQWAYYRSSNSTSGWSALGGQTYGAYYRDQDPNGSSSGSAVASSLGLAAGSIGTETDGSIVLPSSWGNVVGIKPTVGLTSRSLVIPISEHLDTVGPISTNVKDGAIILQAIAGFDAKDNYTSAIPNHGVIPDYVAACNYYALAGARIGIPRSAMALRATQISTYGPQVQIFDKAVSIMRDAGAVIVENSDFTAAAELLNSTVEGLVTNADFIVGLSRYFNQLVENPENVTSLEDVRQFTQSFGLEDYPNRDTKVWDDALFEQRWNNTDPRFWEAYMELLYYGGEGGLLGAIERDNLDAIIMPANGSPIFAAGAGAPVISVPLGFYAADTTVVKNDRGMPFVAPGIPFGISFMGARFSEAKLIGLAYAYEQRTRVRDRGKLIIEPTTELRDVLASY